jgi:hypothetical protein
MLMHLRDGQCDRGRVLSEGVVRRMREDRILAVYDGTTAGMAGRTTGATTFARDDGAFIAIEGDSGQTGGAMPAAVKPVLDASFDAVFGAP